ncbi:rho guanine nucleotide exchange factor 8-like isoform X2 [Zingiber officinale]|uniref:rho guanine nucleotide exchange factor 8-like isoform X2 n=1 Tax=Zingiber officinale TaxID=94328 RepID=UPI001C4B9C33|nr:rho guanine nucleotide exchange factor 8-like isoform X2 [Zingiber officinale]
MVRFLKRGHGAGKPYDEERDEGCGAAVRQAESPILEDASWDVPAFDDYDDDDYGVLFQDQGEPAAGRPRKAPLIGDETPSEIELFKDRYAKLLLGEDMSGCGKGVPSSLALSNAITNLAASIFGEHSRLEPMSAERKARWRREMDWLLSVTDHIVEFVPSRQTSEDGATIEIMITQQRGDLQMNIPALRKLDAMLIGSLDDFEDQTMFSYVSRDADESEKGNARRDGDKWWLPTVRVPLGGFSESSRRWIQLRKDSATQQSVKIPPRRRSACSPLLHPLISRRSGDELVHPRHLWTRVRTLSLLMVRFLKRGHGCGKPYDEECDEGCGAAVRQAESPILEDVSWDVSAFDDYDDDDYDVLFQDQGEPAAGRPSKAPLIGDETPSEIELFKDRYAKLLLGEDMSGCGKGVPSSLALSKAITNLAEPMSAERKARWRREMDWLLSVTDHIVEFVPARQTSEDGATIEIMITQQRGDLQMNIPVLRKLDAMLIGSLDDFEDQTMFSYVSRDADESEKGNARRDDDKWWLPTVRVPLGGLSESSRRWIQLRKDSATQVHKAAMAINAQVLMEMEVPEAYVESLPKNGRESLGDTIYQSIIDDVFDPEEFLGRMDLSTEHKILDLKNRIEASVVIWKRKMQDKESKPSWASAVSLEKRELFEERAEIILILIKQRFPGIPQSALDISKIQYNKM